MKGWGKKEIFSILVEREREEKKREKGRKGRERRER